jgi:hypothetical protein
MKLKWKVPVRLVTLTAAAQMLSAMDQFMQVIETSMTKMDMRAILLANASVATCLRATPDSAQPIVRCGWIGRQCKLPRRLYRA